LQRQEKGEKMPPAYVFSLEGQRAMREISHPQTARKERGKAFFIPVMGRGRIAITEITERRKEGVSSLRGGGRGKGRDLRNFRTVRKDFEKKGSPTDPADQLKKKKK